MKGTSSIMSETVMAVFILNREDDMKGNGRTIKWVVLVNFTFKMAISLTKDIGKIISTMDREEFTMKILAILMGNRIIKIYLNLEVDGNTMMVNLKTIWSMGKGM